MNDMHFTDYRYLHCNHRAGSGLKKFSLDTIDGLPLKDSLNFRFYDYSSISSLVGQNPEMEPSIFEKHFVEF